MSARYSTTVRTNWRAVAIFGSGEDPFRAAPICTSSSPNALPAAVCAARQYGDALVSATTSAMCARSSGSSVPAAEGRVEPHVAVQCNRRVGHSAYHVCTASQCGLGLCQHRAGLSRRSNRVYGRYVLHHAAESRGHSEYLPATSVKSGRSVMDWPNGDFAARDKARCCRTFALPGVTPSSSAVSCTENPRR